MNESVEPSNPRYSNSLANREGQLEIEYYVSIHCTHFTLYFYFFCLFSCCIFIFTSPCFSHFPCIICCCDVVNRCTRTYNPTTNDSLANLWLSHSDKHWKDGRCHTRVYLTNIFLRPFFCLGLHSQLGCSPH